MRQVVVMMNIGPRGGPDMDETNVRLDGKHLTLEEIEAVAIHGIKAELTGDAEARIAKSRRCIEGAVGKGRPIYGVNTGFGALSNVIIDKSQTKALQANLIRSHCTGVGDPFEEREVRAMLLLRANTFALGNSGVRLGLVNHLLNCLNSGIHPVVPQKGSVGASGDLAPAAHLTAALLGEGEVFFKGNRMKAIEALKRAGIKPASLSAKEGLAMINGTQAMTASGVLSLLRAERLAKTADIAGAATLDALRGTLTAFDPAIQAARPHPGQMEVSKNFFSLMKGSEITVSHKDCPRVQDAYSLRCIPQVHGAVRDVLRYARNVLTIEANSATDNPLVFCEEGSVESGGNFHGEPVAFALDFLGIAASELGSISERRIEKLLNPVFSQLPPFLTDKGGLHSGLMMIQVSAAALASENKLLASPASVDSIPTSSDKEDHVSMGATASRKLKEILTNVTNILAMEMLASTQGLYFLKPLEPGEGIKRFYEVVRDRVPPILEDRCFHNDIVEIYGLIESGLILEEVGRSVGTLC
jgi:histidine ammonia-lyase